MFRWLSQCMVAGFLVGGLLVLVSDSVGHSSAQGTAVSSPTECVSTTSAENAELVRGYIDDVYNAHEPARVADYLSDDFNRTNPSRPHQNQPGLDDDIARVQRSLDEFPDLTGTIEHLVADGDIVMVQVTMAGTHQGAFADLGVPATGRRAEWSAVFVWRIECGKIVEGWAVTDRLTEYRQLGIITDDELSTVDISTVATPEP